MQALSSASISWFSFGLAGSIMLCFYILAVLSIFCSAATAFGAGNVTTDQDGYAPV